MIGDIDPVCAPLHRTIEHREAAAIDPVEHAGVGRCLQRERRAEQCQYPRDAATAERGVQIHPHGQLHDQRRVVMTDGRGQRNRLSRVRRHVILGRSGLIRPRSCILCRQRTGFPACAAVLQIPDLDLRSAKTLLLVQRFRLPHIAGSLEPSGQTGRRALARVHQRVRSPVGLSCHSAPECGHAFGVCRCPAGASAERVVSVKVARSAPTASHVRRHRSCMDPPAPFSIRLNILPGGRLGKQRHIRTFAKST